MGVLAKMKTTLLIIAAITVYLGGGVAGDTEKDSTIGYCENIDVPDDDFISLNWLGAAGAIVSVLPGPQNNNPFPVIGGLFNLMAQFSRDTDWAEYMENLGKCVEAMIREAIETDNLAECENNIKLIKDDYADLIGYFENLADDPGYHEKIDQTVFSIENAVDDIWNVYARDVDVAYRHEKFADSLLDAIAMEGVARVVSVAAMKCAEVPQVDFERHAFVYLGKLQDRLDKEFNDELPTSIMYNLRNSDFYTWRDNITKAPEQNCNYDPRPPGCYCNGGYRCVLIDHYRYDKEFRWTTRTGCKCEARRGECSAGQGGIDSCNEWYTDAKNYAIDTYDTIATKTTNVTIVTEHAQDWINDILENGVEPSDCEKLLGGKRVTGL